MVTHDVGCARLMEMILGRRAERASLRGRYCMLLEEEMRFADAISCERRLNSVRYIENKSSNTAETPVWRSGRLQFTNQRQNI